MKQYQVQAGDSLANIARHWLGSASRSQEIVELNHIEDPAHIRIGQWLFMPSLHSGPARTESDMSRSNGLIYVTVEQLYGARLTATETLAREYNEALNQNLVKYGINTPLRICHFLAQLSHHSCGFSRRHDSLTWTSAELLARFPEPFNDLNTRFRDSLDPVYLNNYLYANQLGNGDVNSGDGYMYRGRGLLPLVGRDNYRAFGEHIGRDLLSRPGIVADDLGLSVRVAAWLWQRHGVNLFADKDQIDRVTLACIGSEYGLIQRKDILERAKKVLNVN